MRTAASFVGPYVCGRNNLFPSDKLICGNLRLSSDLLQTSPNLTFFAIVTKKRKKKTKEGKTERKTERKKEFNSWHATPSKGEIQFKKSHGKSLIHCQCYTPFCLKRTGESILKWTDKADIRKTKFLAGDEARKSIFWPIPDLKKGNLW